MKLIVKDINYTDNVFYGIVGSRKIGFYLSNRLSQVFMETIKIGYLVDFEITNNKRKIGQKKYIQVNHFNLIKNLKTGFDLYNHHSLQTDMVSFLKSHDYYLFLDLEMTIAGYGEKNYKPEIIQYGYVLMDKEGNTIKQADNYLQTTGTKPINKRTFWFLKIEKRTYEQLAIPYQIFYNELKNIIQEYHPKFVVWGKNDIATLNHSYKINKVPPLSTGLDFVDLLRLHRDFFNLRNDLGLFNAYKEYYDKEALQTHNAGEDAKVTKKVFKAFVTYASKAILD